MVDSYLPTNLAWISLPVSEKADFAIGRSRHTISCVNRVKQSEKKNDFLKNK